MPSLEEIPRLIRKETLRRHFFRVQGVEDREAWQHTFRSEAIAHTEKLQGSGRLHSAGVRKPLSPASEYAATQKVFDFTASMCRCKTQCAGIKHIKHKNLILRYSTSLLYIFSIKKK